MASSFYPSALTSLLKGDIDLESGTVKAALVDTGVYTFSTAHDFYDDVSAGVAGTPATLSSKTFTDGVFDAADVTISAVAAAGSVDSVNAVVIYVDTGTASTSPVVAYLDGLALALNGSDIEVAWDASGIFALGATA